MMLPFALPDWLPWWVTITILVPTLLWLLAFLSMPFHVFGLKGRLDLIEARLDEVQGEIRSLALRLPEPALGAGFDELYASAPAPVEAPLIPVAPDRRAPRPPIPPPPREWDRTRDGGWEAGRRDQAASGGRAEPRLNWPR